ncbi:hypothetical protein GHT09_006532 [Marmota monax]|uniref:Uncharacterized protein n=1 Tax=Marmota monax TaxID=9995 RepID=A0A834UL89_MARMO|nr:hypothetical protein GHT09_006532 [Marmota monax]
MAALRAHAAARAPRLEARPGPPGALGREAPRPAAREPATARLCWGCSPPSGALGKRLPAAWRRLTPWGSRCSKTHLRGRWNESRAAPDGPHPETLRRRVLGPWKLLAGSGKAKDVTGSTGL